MRNGGEGMEYSIICIYTSEEARWEGKPLPDAVMRLLRDRQLAARYLLTRGIAGCYEDGEEATSRVEVLSFNMPLKIEIVLPTPEVEVLLPRISEMVTEGIVGITEMRVTAHKVRHHLVPRHLKVRDVMTPNPQRVQPASLLSQALEILLTSDFTGLPVVDDQSRPVGIITDGDLVYRAGIPIRVRLLAEFANSEVGSLKESLGDRPVSAIMTSPVLTVRQDQYLFEAVDIMLKQGLRRLPVADDGGSLVGILSRIDIFKAISKETPASRQLRDNGIILVEPHRVGDVMRKDTPSVSPDTPLEQVIKLLGNSAIERVAVVDGEGKLLGLISDHAMLGAFSEHKEGVWDYLMRTMSLKDMGERHEELIKRYYGTKAGQVMERTFASVGEDTPLEEAARIMTEKRIKRLPVLDAQGHLLGVLRREALLRLGSSNVVAGSKEKA